MSEELTRKQIYELRGKLKAAQRAKAMRKRTEQAHHRYIIKTQHEIAKRMIERMGEY